MKKFIKITSALAIITILLACLTAYYINAVLPDLQAPNLVTMKNHLVDSKSQAWLQNRIDIGKNTYKQKLFDDQKAWAADLELHKAKVAKCISEGEAYRMKNAYECKDAQQMSIFSSDSGFSAPKPTFSAQKQDEFIDTEILRECINATSIKHARKIGCHY
ncbi:MAG: hypothetical protein ACSHXY_10325 [Alphaproteobacteria bacterium]